MNHIRLIQKGVFASMCALAVLAVVGCAEEVSELFGSNGPKVEVTATVGPTQSNALTRGADGLDGTSGFSLLWSSNNSSKVKIFADDGSGSFTDYSYKVTGATAIEAESSTPTFPASVTSVSVYGWYPYTAASSFTIQTNQQTDANYCLSDLMLAQPANCTRVLSTGVVTAAALNFQHVMSKVKIVVSPASGVTITGISLGNVKPTTAISYNANGSPKLSAGEASGTAGTVTLLSGGSITSANTAAQRTFCGVFPAQSISGSFITITASSGGGSGTITYSFPSAKAFASGNEYTANIEIGASQIGQTVSLADWTGAEGTVNIGAGGGGGSLALSESTMNLTQGGTKGTMTLSGTVKLSSTGASSFNVVSSNTGVATVSVTGTTITVDPVGVGTTTITLSDADDASNNATCEVTVRAANGIDYTEINSAHIGYVVATNGKCYANVAAATEDGATEILGMLIYVGAHTGKTTSGGNTNTSQTVSCTNGVIAALQDAGTDSDRMYNNTLPTNNNAWTARDYTSTAITSLGSWVSATDNDWKDFMVACSNAYIAQGLSGATVTADSNTPVAFWALMERCGGTGATAVVAGGQHWTNCGVSSRSPRTTYSWPYFSVSEWAVASDNFTDAYDPGDYDWSSSNGAQGYAVRAVRAF